MSCGFILICRARKIVHIHTEQEGNSSREWVLLSHQVLSDSATPRTAVHQASLNTDRLYKLGYLRASLPSCSYYSSVGFPLWTPHLVSQSCPTLCNSMDCSPPSSSVHEDSPDKNTGVGCRVGCHALLQGIFPIRESNQGLCRWSLSQLRYQGRTLQDPNKVHMDHLEN